MIDHRPFFLPETLVKGVGEGGGGGVQLWRRMDTVEGPRTIEEEKWVGGGGGGALGC